MAEKERIDKGGARNNRRTKKKICAFCADKVESIDYKDIAKLRKYVSERGKIVSEKN